MKAEKAKFSERAKPLSLTKADDYLCRIFRNILNQKSVIVVTACYCGIVSAIYMLLTEISSDGPILIIDVYCF